MTERRYTLLDVDFSLADALLAVIALPILAVGVRLLIVTLVVMFGSPA